MDLALANISDQFGVLGKPSTSRLPNMKTAIAAVKAGTVGARARWAMVGDSTTAGAGSNGAGGGAGTGATIAPTALRSKSLARELANKFTAAGVAARSDAVFGNAALGTSTVANYSLYNPDAVFSGSWTLSTTTVLCLGGFFFNMPAAGSGSITFTPQFSTNRLEVGYSTLTGGGGFVVTDASGTLATIDTNGALGFGRTTVTRAVSSTAPFVISNATSGVTNVGAQTFLAHLIPYSTVSPMVEIWNMGHIGSKVSDWTNTGHPYGGLPVVQSTVADLWSVDLGANDINGAVPAATYQSGLSTLVSAFGTVGTPDKLIVEVHPTNPAAGSFDIPTSYRTAMATIAAGGNLLSPVDFSNAGLVLSDYFDSIHLANSGYAKEASLLFGSVRSQFGI
jgi:hypothetical protein